MAGGFNGGTTIEIGGSASCALALREVNGSPKGRVVRGMTKPQASIPPDRIAEAILLLRGHRVMLDSTLAGLYGVETRTLVQALKRNADRFPVDFCFQPSAEEARSLRSQTVMSRPRQSDSIYAVIFELAHC